MPIGDQNKGLKDSPEERKRKKALILFLKKMKEEEGEGALAEWCVFRVLDYPIEGA